jgi:hypothetical protein
MWDCAYANEFTFADEDLNVDEVRTIAQETIGLYEGA